MAETVIDRATAKFFSLSESLSRCSRDISIEDCRFIKFTEALELSGVVENPTFCRYAGGRINAPWSLLGYSFKLEKENESYPTNQENGDESDVENDFSEFHSYVFINGIFHGTKIAEKSKKQDIIRVVNNTHRFIESTIKLGSDFIVKDSHDIVDLQWMLLNSYKKKYMDRIKILIITDYELIQDDLPKTIEVKGSDIECKIDYWDIRRWSDIIFSKTKREPVNFSLVGMGYKTVNSISSTNFSSHKCYLSLFPGNLIADLYDDFHIRLLESNVRLFLSLKRKNNQNILDTIKENPEFFLSYNNGISATASNIKFVSDSNIIESIEDFQIVNGGQTTATLFYSKNKKKLDLSNVFVQVKITVIRDPDVRRKSVPNISLYSNTQTAISKSDLHANDPSLIEIEKLSRKCYYVDSTQINTYYYFERMNGQYDEERNNQGLERNQSEWQKRYPEDNSFNKIDLGRWMNILNSSPHLAASSAEKSFEAFFNGIKDRTFRWSISEFKDLVGFGMIFRRARKLCGTKNSKQFPSIIGDPSVGMATTIYCMSLFHLITENRFDYHKIFNKECNEDFIDDVLRNLLILCWKVISVSGGTSGQEYAKRKECWDNIKKLKIKKNDLEKLKLFMISEDVRKIREQGEISEDHLYFILFNKFFSNGGKVFMFLHDLATTNNTYIKYRSTFNNVKKQIESKDSRITLVRLQTLDEMWEQVSNSGIFPNEAISSTFNFNFDVNALYENLFTRSINTLNHIQQKIVDQADLSLENMIEDYNKIQEIVEEYKSWECLSIQQLELAQELLRKYHIL